MHHECYVDPRPCPRDFPPARIFLPAPLCGPPQTSVPPPANPAHGPSPPANPARRAFPACEPCPRALPACEPCPRAFPARQSCPQGPPPASRPQLPVRSSRHCSGREPSAHAHPSNAQPAGAVLGGAPSSRSSSAAISHLGRCCPDQRMMLRSPSASATGSPAGSRRLVPPRPSVTPARLRPHPRRPRPGSTYCQTHGLSAQKDTDTSMIDHSLDPRGGLRANRLDRQPAPLARLVAFK